MKCSVLTYILRHSRDNHEIIRHGENIVDIELGKPGVKIGVKQIHKLDQLHAQKVLLTTLDLV